MMPYEQFAEYLEEKSGNYFQCLYYQVPNQDLKRGLVRVSDNRSLSYMFDVEKTFGRLNLYLDHLDMNLLEYLSQAIIYEMDACVSKTICPPKKRYCNDFSMDEMVDWAEMDIEQHGGSSQTITTDKGKEKVCQDATKVVEDRRSTVESEYDSDDDSDYQLDKLVDYLSLGEEQLIEVRNKMKANREAKAKAKDNLISEMNEPNDENSILADNVKGETFEEHDINMNELLKSLKTAEKNGITEDPFIYVEKHVDRFSMYDEITHGDLRNQRSYGNMVVAKCGQRPPRLSDHEKGKQRKQTRYPSASSDELPTCTWICYARFYVCFAGLADEGKARCRKIIALDGCFLKSSNQGEILTAIGRDENNHIYQMAWAVGLIEAVKDIMQDMCFVAYHNFVKPISCMNFWHYQSMYSTVLPQKPRKMPGRPRKKSIRAIGGGGSSTRVSKVGSHVSRPRKKQSVGDLEDVDVVLRGPVRNECVGRSRGGGASRFTGGASGSRGGASGSRGGASGSRGGASVSREGDGGFRRGAEQTQDEPQQTRREPVQTQDKDQVEQT
nr:peroxidase 20 [Tanacetum cinerariifolium]